ncbi:WGR domain-containing protein [Nonomuraea sp. B1E8]|uniref:WGR domain-containing protein n=1 Tax=unclassified Nonomuraea TaxID=2593643 RepID=UPI00325D6F60
MSMERTLTFVGGGSAKLWEVRQDGAELHVRYGRLGAAGQTQVKSFGSAAVATAAADKPVAEKLRRGYTEDETAPSSQGASSPQAASPVASPAAAGSVEDEDRLTLPPTWLRALHPRRGGAKVSVKRPDASAPKKLAAELGERRKVLADMVAKCPDPELTSAGAAYLTGEPASSTGRSGGRQGAGRVPAMDRARGGGRDRAGLAGLLSAWSPGQVSDDELTARIGARLMTAARRTARTGYTSGH